MALSRDFKEFIEFLNQNEVRYLVVGGYAVSFHGYPRYTKDLDIWIQVSADNADRVVRAITDFGFASLGLKQEDFLQPGVIVQIGYPPLRIDLLTQPSGVDFASCYANKIAIDLDGLKVDVIGLEDLKTNKRASGRTQDMLDLENLE